MQSRRLLVVPLLAILALVAGCSDLSGTQGGAYVTGDGQIKVWPTAKRGEPVDLTGDTLDGGTWSAKDNRGKPVVVNVWWSNCGPCRKEMPMLQAAAADLEGKATFIGVNTRDNSADNGISFERSIGVSYPSLYSPDGAALLALPGLPRALPSTVVLDADGRIAATVSGQLPSKLTLTELVGCIADDQASDDCKVKS
ncbi:TlpA disulfide reductase family protein [Nocardioides sp. Kera G14]|uniref:TlpA disulfide reductase family protein n=1 Tax=Nocardioides sp. Kera G14 TaxID=2884264 RepID=UPI001D113539|nr:TlpA disulfide reductase family protein [Nocardioides sp. Kera G14]UDY23888.1 TlpA family protein disulfide reductase [Nocardioides sp. Kera G14]